MYCTANTEVPVCRTQRHTSPHSSGPTTGASGYETENALNAFELTVDQGADGLKSNVQITKDQQLVFSHNYAVKWKAAK